MIKIIDCLNDQDLEDEILNGRINAKKNILLKQLLQFLLTKKNIMENTIMRILKKILKFFKI